MIALLGNPNCGKSSIFNILTKSSRKIGNYNGVTVDYKIGLFKDKKIVDLPGIYSLNPYTKEEEITIKFINKNKIDLIINVIDINSLNRSLYLTLRLLDLNIPLVIALNKCESNNSINIDLLEKILNIKVIKVSALKNIGIDNLKKEILKNNYVCNYKIEFNNDITSIYKKIDRITSEVIKNKIKKRNRFKLIIKYKYLFIIISIFMFILIYYFSINIIGNIINSRINIIMNYINTYLLIVLNKLKLSIILKKLILDGIINGITNTINFIPQLFFLIFILSIIEDTGFINIIAILFNNFLNKIGISSNSLHSLFLATNCSAMAIMSTRTIKNEIERKKVIFLIPLIPCCAKISIMVFIISNFYNSSFLIFLSFYLILIFIIFLLSIIFKKNKSKLIMEIPQLKIPSIKVAYKESITKTKSFIKRIITIMIFISILNFFLSSFDISLNYVKDIKSSILYFTSSKLSIIFKPFIGINSPSIFLSIISGFFAKEQVVSTINTLKVNLNYITAYTFCIFNIFTIPCINTLSIMKKECGIKLTIVYNLIYILISYIVSVIIFRLLFFI